MYAEECPMLPSKNAKFRRPGQRSPQPEGQDTRQAPPPPRLSLILTPESPVTPRKEAKMASDCRVNAAGSTLSSTRGSKQATITSAPYHS